MKKLLPMITAVLLLWTIVASAAEIPVFIDGARLDFDVQPLMVNERTMVPMRFIFEKLGATVNYDEETSTISAFRTNTNGESVIILIQINNPKAFVNSETIELDSPPVEIDGRTLVPLRFVGEALGCKVDWNEQEESVYISTSRDSEAIKQIQQESAITEDETYDEMEDETYDPMNKETDDETEDEIYDFEDKTYE